MPWSPAVCRRSAGRPSVKWAAPPSAAVGSTAALKSGLPRPAGQAPPGVKVSVSLAQVSNVVPPPAAGATAWMKTFHAVWSGAVMAGLGVSALLPPLPPPLAWASDLVTAADLTGGGAERQRRNDDRQ